MFPDFEFEFAGVAAPSGVSDQPMSSAETRLGAANRARAARESAPEADYWIGLEGGAEQDESGMQVFGWVCVLARSGEIGAARSASFYLPGKIAELVRGGLELGDADAAFFQRENFKQAEGTAGVLTGGAVDRAEQFVQAVVFALVSFRNPDWYSA